MPVNVARNGHVSPQHYSSTQNNHLPVKEPGPRIIRDKADGHVVPGVLAAGHYIAHDRIHEIRRVAPRSPDNIKVVLEYLRQGRRERQ